MTKRLDYLDMAKGIGVILVLLGHLQGERFFSFSPYILPMCEWIFSFHMPLFFIIAGILINHKNETDKDIKDIAKKRFKGIMVPYFWFSFFYLGVVIYALINKSVLPQVFYVNLWYVLGMYGMNVLWFLPTLFMAELIFLFILKKYNSKIAVSLLIVLGGLGLAASYYMTNLSYEFSISQRIHETCQMITRPFVAVTFILIGYYGYYLLKKNFLSKKVLCIALGIVMMLVGASLVGINHGVDFRSLVFKNVFFYYICSVLGSFGLILVCKGLPKIRLISFWGVNSLIFMAVHNSETVLFLGLKLSMYVNQFITHARGYICYGIVVLVILLYVSIMTLLINRFVPFIVGKPYKVKNKTNI